jgi:hypothetical protein
MFSGCSYADVCISLVSYSRHGRYLAEEYAYLEYPGVQQREQEANLFTFRRIVDILDMQYFKK